MTTPPPLISPRRSSMEKWALNHPKLGLIELEVGYDSEFLELDPTWPEEPKEDEEIRPVTADSGLKERFGALFNNPSVRARILLNGQVLHRVNTAASGRYLLEDSEGSVDRKSTRLNSSHVASS